MGGRLDFFNHVSEKAGPVAQTAPVPALPGLGPQQLIAEIAVGLLDVDAVKPDGGGQPGGPGVGIFQPFDGGIVHQRVVRRQGTRWAPSR